MRFYRLDRRAEYGESFGYEFFTTQREVQQAYKDWMAESVDSDRGNTEIEEIHVLPSKDGILRALNLYAGHNDNG